MKKEKRSTVTLSKEDFIKKKSRKVLFFWDFVILLMALLIIWGYCDFDNNTLTIYLPAVIAIHLCIIQLKRICYMIFDSNFDRISSVNLINESLSDETYTEVIPLPEIYEHSYFLVSLTNIAKFYAIIKNESGVSIYVQFNTEGELRFLENIPKEEFHIRYKLQ